MKRVTELFIFKVFAKKNSHKIHILCVKYVEIQDFSGQHTLRESVRIRSFCCPHFPVFGLFSPNVKNCGPEKLWILTLFTQGCSYICRSVFRILLSVKIEIFNKILNTPLHSIFRYPVYMLEQTGQIKYRILEYFKQYQKNKNTWYKQVKYAWARNNSRILIEDPNKHTVHFCIQHLYNFTQSKQNPIFYYSLI